MLTELPQKFLIDPIIEQVNNLSLTKRMDINQPTGKFFNDPWVVKPEFKDTPLGNVLESLGSIGQARLLTLDSAESYTAHSDPDDRIHLAIITNPYCFLVDVENRNLYHLPADGRIWYMDTGPLHVATNWGGRPRVHLNIRMLLPRFDPLRSGFHLKITGGDFDWKQEASIEIMKTINQLIKSKEVTGFDATDKEVFINCNNYDVFEPIINTIQNKNISINLEKF